MAKKFAVLVRERQGEALRAALGLTLADDRVEVYVLDRPLEDTPENREHLGALRETAIPVFTNRRGDPGLAYLATEEIARRILLCDSILPY